MTKPLKTTYESACFIFSCRLLAGSFTKKSPSKIRPVGRFQILGGQREKRALMRSEHTLGFLGNVFGRDGYFKYWK